jgi:hypothetical protein
VVLSLRVLLGGFELLAAFENDMGSKGRISLAKPLRKAACLYGTTSGLHYVAM